MPPRGIDHKQNRVVGVDRHRRNALNHFLLHTANFRMQVDTGADVDIQRLVVIHKTEVALTTTTTAVVDPIFDEVVIFLFGHRLDLSGKSLEHFGITQPLAAIGMHRGQNILPIAAE